MERPELQGKLLNSSRRVGVLANQLAAAAPQGYLRQQRAPLPADADKVIPETSEYLRGGFAPVADEIDAAELRVVDGALPPTLRGSFVRNGPNPQYEFHHRNYHWFDGDGMLHRVVLEGTDRAPSYRNRFVRTARFLADAAAGYSVAELGEFNAGNFEPALRREGVDRSTGQRMGRANTAVVPWRGELLCLEENDKPYAVDPRSLATLGRRDFGGTLTHNMTAHPKHDPTTGELIFFGYSVSPSGPWLHYAVACPDTGELARSFPVPLPAPVMMHDMCITPRFSVLLDWGYEFSFERIGEGKAPFAHERDRPARFGVLPRHATSAEELRWLDAAPMSLFHFAAAWEEPSLASAGGTDILVLGCRGETVDLAASTLPDDEAALLREPERQRGQRLWEWRLDLEAGTVSERQLGAQWIEFATASPAVTCRRPRYVYASRFCHRPGSDSPGAPWIDGVVKYDLDTGSETVHAFPAGHFGGEPVFAATGDAAGAEDEGFLLTFVTDEAAGTSELVVLDARDEHFAAVAPQCRVRMPRRIPYGFHGTWLPAEGGEGS